MQKKPRAIFLERRPHLGIFLGIQEELFAVPLLLGPGRRWESGSHRVLNVRRAMWVFHERLWVVFPPFSKAKRP